MLAEIRTTATETDGGIAEEIGMVLVLSRPCNALRDGKITVARIVARPIPDLTAAETISELAAVFQGVRDGEGAPDSFYLGEVVAGTSDRHFAKLDALYTVKVPLDVPTRAAFLAKHRRFRLNDEFARDLQLRIFRAFASLGFDDMRWWSDGDLGLIARKGEALRVQLQGELQSAQSAVELLNTAGGAKRDVKAKAQDAEMAQGRLRKLEEELTPFLEEQRSRAALQPDGGGASGAAGSASTPS